MWHGGRGFDKLNPADMGEKFTRPTRPPK